jgi:hypothetical protein
VGSGMCTEDGILYWQLGLSCQIICEEEHRCSADLWSDGCQLVHDICFIIFACTKHVDGL